jgi:hypothetical protein
VKLATFELDGRHRVGVVDGDTVVDIGFDGDMVAFIAGGEASLADASRPYACLRRSSRRSSSTPARTTGITGTRSPPSIRRSRSSSSRHRSP